MLNKQRAVGYVQITRGIYYTTTKLLLTTISRGLVTLTAINGHYLLFAGTRPDSFALSTNCPTFINRQMRLREERVDLKSTELQH